ncbi:putative RNA-directed DNA polymerase [Senna tora]|uniref:Putative RNA-directed DNA polymerase n=1 Tax=Senna tora TaxID=362788 RepID=A0A834X1W1_9FABA|nr:putative RNA-directed DNA polymerase [Senna tora]
MSGSAASSSSASSPSSDAKTYSLFSSSVQTASVKLDRSNYMLWEATVRPLIIGNRLFSHVDGVSTAPPVHLTVDGQQGSSNQGNFPPSALNAGPQNINDAAWSRAGIFKPKIPYVGLVDAGVDSGSDSKSLAEFTKRLNSVFALKDLGPLYYFLGIEIHRDQSGFYLNQSKYAQDVLKRFNMANCASVTTPMVTGRKFTAQDGDKMSDPSLFRRAIGSL